MAAADLRATRSWALRRTMQVVAAGALERLYSPPARTREDVPRGPEAITARWLTAALCAGREDVYVAAVEPTGGSAGTTTRQSIRITYGGAGAKDDLPTRLFVKCTTTLAQRLMLGLGGLIDGEPGFYMHVRPELDIEAPIGYFGASDRRTWRSIVVMEDVAATREARFWDPETQIGREQMQDLLGNVASWHARLWDSPRLARWRWLRTPVEQMRLIDSLIALANRVPAGARRAASVIPLPLRQRQDDLFEAMRRSMQIVSRGPRTYLHGDLHVANTFRTGAGRMGVSDWQVGLQGSWAHDFAYLMATALQVEHRRAWEQDLLAFYLERLRAAGGAVLAPEAAWLAYRQATFYPYFAWVYTIGRARLQPRFQPDTVSLTMIQRISAAIDDLDCLAAVGL